MKTALRAFGILVGALVFYVATYLLVMKEGTSYDPNTGEPEYGSFCRFVPSVRLPYDISIYGRPSHWTNRLYAPLDTLFKRPKPQGWHDL